MLRVITIAGVVVALGFLTWSFLVMSGGRDWLMANMATGEKPPEKVAAKEEPPKEAEAEPSQGEARADSQADSEESQAEAKPDAANPDAVDTPASEAASTEDAPASAESDAGAAGDTGDEGEAASTEAGATEGGSEVDPAGNPLETAKAAEKGTLKSPYRDNYESVAEEGHKKYMAAGCNGCHGGTGGGGMGPPLSNPVWVYGNDGDTLFRLIALGTNGLQEQGYSRKGSENVVGPMPPHGSIVKSNDDMWKIIGWIWSVNPPDKP